MNRTVKDMTQGNPFSLIIGFAVPMLIGTVFQQLYSMADTMVAGRWLGVDALAAIGSTGSINFLIVGFCIGMASGFAVPVAQRFGAGDYKAMRKFAANCLWLGAVFSLVITFLACFFCQDILVLMKTPGDILDGANRYVFFIFLGIPITFLYNILSGLLRALGDSRTPVYFLIISGFLNVVLDIVSIRVFGMGVEGPALATVISQLVSSILCLIHIIRKFEILHIKADEWRLDKHCIGTLFSMGIPMGLQSSVTAIGCVILQTAVNSLGSLAVASMTAGDRIIQLFFAVFNALGTTVATYAGQNIGAKRVDRVDAGLRSALIICMVYSVLSFVILLFFGRPLMHLFIDSNEAELLNQGHLYILWNSGCFIFLTFVHIVRSNIQGMGFGALTLFAGLLELVARSLIGIAFVPVFGFTAVCFSAPFAWLLADLFLIPAYFYCRKKLTRIFKQDEELADMTQDNTAPTVTDTLLNQNTDSAPSGEAAQNEEEPADMTIG
ncbi:MAG: MATE family efflux transporter [Clostridiales bacterium]|nr:MATE family efflux transporter [Clostridiales bacterium]